MAAVLHVIAAHVYNQQFTSLGALWNSNTIKLAFINSSTTPSVTDSDPRWGTGGTQNYSTNEVSGGNCTAGGVTISGTAVASPASGVIKLNATNPVLIASHASNPTTARWGIIYDSTDTGKHVIGYLDLGADTDLTSGFSLFLNNTTGAGTQAFFSYTAS